MHKVSVKVDSAQETTYDVQKLYGCACVKDGCACVKFGGGRVYIVLDNLLSKYVIVRYFE